MPRTIYLYKEIKYFHHHSSIILSNISEIVDKIFLQFERTEGNIQKSSTSKRFIGDDSKWFRYKPRIQRVQHLQSQEVLAFRLDNFLVQKILSKSIHINASIKHFYH